MSVLVLVSVLKCAVVVLMVGAVPVPSQGKKAEVGEKKLRNVIITSFGEMPYEPMESGGYYQSEIIPVNNFNDEIQQQTMDVALRTGILVEDPNEKKTADEDDKNDEIEETSLEDEATSTNAKRQAINENSKEDKQLEEDEDDFLSPRVRDGFRKSKDREQPKESSDKFLSHPLNYGYELPQRRKSQIPYRPYPSAKSFSVYNNRPYDAELGEGWNLQDAETILKGRNYNILVVTPNHYPYPGPHFRETPPPPFLSGARQPLFYSFPNYDYSSGFDPHRGAISYSSYVHPPVSKRQVAEERISNNKHRAPSSHYQSRAESVPHFQEDYSGV